VDESLRLEIPHAAAGTPAEPAVRLGELFDRHRPFLDRLARRLVDGREEARDLVQETFLRAARRPARIPLGAEPERAWLVRVLINLVRDARRRQRVRARAAAARPPAPPTPSPAGAAEARALVAHGLAALSVRQRSCLVLAELEGLATPEIARQLGVAAVTVRWHLAAARRAFARAVGAPPEEVAHGS
jgi:RNA polymerase sigma-70 factor (ECF subfamily)